MFVDGGYSLIKSCFNDPPFSFVFVKNSSSADCCDDFFSSALKIKTIVLNYTCSDRLHFWNYRLMLMCKPLQLKLKVTQQINLKTCSQL